MCRAGDPRGGRARGRKDERAKGPRDGLAMGGARLREANGRRGLRGSEPGRCVGLSLPARGLGERAA